MIGRESKDIEMASWKQAIISIRNYIGLSYSLTCASDVKYHFVFYQTYDQ